MPVLTKRTVVKQTHMQDSFSLYGIANTVFDGYRVGVILIDNATYSPCCQVNASNSLCERKCVFYGVTVYHILAPEVE